MNRYGPLFGGSSVDWGLDFDVELDWNGFPRRKKYRDIIGLWETGFDESRYRHASKYVYLNDLDIITTETLLDRLMKTMPVVLDLGEDEFGDPFDRDSMPAIEDVSDDSFWTWTGFYCRSLERYIFTFETEADAVKFRMYLSAISLAA